MPSALCCLSLREMNKRLRDEKDSQQPQRRVSCRRTLAVPQCHCGRAHSFWAQPF
uniref:Uncharacterized protein n=1 Tax=Anguilla anguilla TaxID=7936 RepID=A0A0E9Q229_ANGAN